MKRPKPYKTSGGGMFDSRTEAAYAARLNTLRLSGEISAWRHHSIRFRLADGTWYTPDFEVVTPECKEIHEVKGFMREAARVRFRAAADLWPEYKWVVVSLDPRTKQWAAAVYPDEMGSVRKGQRKS